MTLPTRGEVPTDRPGASPLGAAAFVAAVAGLTACATSGAAEGEEMGAPGAEAEVAGVRVINDQPENFAVHLVTPGDRHRLGLATAGRTTTFEVTPAMLGGSTTMRLVADPVGSAGIHRSAEIRLDRGDLVEWTLLATPGLSYGTIRVMGGAFRP